MTPAHWKRLVILAVLCIGASAAFSVCVRVNDAGRESRLRALVSRLTVELERFHAEKGYLPQGLEDLDLSYENLDGATSADLGSIEYKIIDENEYELRMGKLIVESSTNGSDDKPKGSEIQ